MTDASARFVISYNGEVYNYRDLKRYLVERHGSIAWKSDTDTEVIVEGFAREGVDFLNLLNGIFALAIYDAETRLLHVLRDPLGIKPLFVTRQLGATFFCSELKGLLAIPGLARTLREESLADQLAFMYVPEPNTLYREFEKVEPGVCLSYREGERISAQPLFDHLREPLEFSSEGDAIERLRAAFSTAVRRQLVADVPVSLFLSGGLDSSAVAQEAVRSGANIKDAYTIAFSDADRERDEQSDDLRYARIMAERLGLELRVVPATEDFIDILPKLMPFMEDGFTDPAAINTYVISSGARCAGNKVMLSGQGADEYLGGYRRYLAEAMLCRLPGWSRPALANALSFASLGLSKLGDGARRRLSRLARLVEQSAEARLVAMYTWTDAATIQELLPAPEVWSGAAALQATFDCFAGEETLAALMKMDQRYDLMSLNLCYTDRMSMATGVEARVPFLDFELVRIMNALPVGLKVKGWQGKYVLKKAMEPLLPREIIYREKAGFGLPIRAWLRNNPAMMNMYLDEKRLERQGLFRSAAVRRLLVEQLSGHADHAYTLFTLLCQQVWLDTQPRQV